jgi:hypothetical protein
VGDGDPREQTRSRYHAENATVLIGVNGKENIMMANDTDATIGGCG